MTDEISAQVYVCKRGKLGCGSVKELPLFSYERKAGAFRPDICDKCLDEMVRIYNVNYKQVRLLCTVLSHEEMLKNQARAMAKHDVEDELRMMTNTAPQRLFILVNDLFKAHETGTLSDWFQASYKVYRAYREWWFLQVGLGAEFSLPTPVKGFSTARIAA